MNNTKLSHGKPSTIPAAKHPPQIWAVASGKGGVGKSFVSTNLGMALAQQGKKVVLVDLDFGSANIHTFLGLANPKTTLSSLLNQSSININDLVEYTTKDNLGLISGAGDHLQMANLAHFQKLKIMRNISQIEADFVILDLGAGTSFNTLDFFLYADQALLTVIPEPTSIENAYRLIKSLLSRQLKGLPENTKEIINRILTEKQHKAPETQTFASFLMDLQFQCPEYANIMREHLKNIRLNLIVNQVREPADSKLAVAMAVVSQKHFDIDLNVLGHLYHDNQVTHSLREKQTYYHQYPQSKNVTSLNRIAVEMIAELASKHQSQTHTPS